MPSVFKPCWYCFAKDIPKGGQSVTTPVFRQNILQKLAWQYQVTTQSGKGSQARTQIHSVHTFTLFLHHTLCSTAKKSFGYKCRYKYRYKYRYEYRHKYRYKYRYKYRHKYRYKYRYNYRYFGRHHHHRQAKRK